MQGNCFIKNLYLPFLIAVSLVIIFCGESVSIFSSVIFISIFTAAIGPKKTFLGMLLLFLCCILSVNILFGFFLIAYTSPALIIGSFIFYKKKFSNMLISATMVQTFVLTAHTLYLSASTQKHPADILFKDSFKEILHLISSAGQFTDSEISQIESMVSYVSKMMQTMLPCIYILVSLFIVYLLFVIVRFLLKKVGMIVDHMPYFHELWLPKELSTIFVLLFIFSLFANSYILSNITSIMFMIHVVCGISMIDLFLLKKSVPSLVRFFILFALFSISSLIGGLFSSVLCCMGMSSRGRMESR